MRPNAIPRLGFSEFRVSSRPRPLSLFSLFDSFLCSFCPLRVPFDRPRLMELHSVDNTTEVRELGAPRKEAVLSSKQRPRSTKGCRTSSRTLSRTTSWIKSSPSEYHCRLFDPLLPPPNRLRRLHDAGRLLSSPFLPTPAVLYPLPLIALPPSDHSGIPPLSATMCSQPLEAPRIIHISDQDDMEVEQQFTELTLKLPGIKDVLVSPTNAVGSIVSPTQPASKIRSVCLTSSVPTLAQRSPLPTLP